MAGCMIAIENRHTGAKSSKLAESREEAIAWIARRLELRPGSPEAYWLQTEPDQVYKTTADLPPQKERYDRWD